MRRPDRQRRPRRLLLRVAALVALGLAAWTVGLFHFATLIPTTVADRTSRTDAIAVLTGGRGRLEAGLALLSEKRAEKLFVSGVYRGVDVARLLELSRHAPDELTCCVDIGHSADNTAGNARETSAWLRRQGYGSLRIVTSAYHMPRSLLEFRANLPDVVIVPHPVFHDRIKQERWWLWPGTATLIISEFHKYGLAWLRQVSADLTAVEGST